MATKKKKAGSVWKKTGAFRVCQKNFGKQVRTLRLQQGLTIEQFTEIVEMDVKLFQKLEGGTNINPTLLTMFRIAQGLSVPLHSVLLRPPPSKTR